MRSRRGLAAHLGGLAAEDIAAAAYEARGCALLARRWRCASGELDLVAEAPDGTLLFVEVKSGRGAATRATIAPRQWRRLEAAALEYIVQADKGGAAMRFDAVFILPDGRAEIVENAHMSEQG